MNVNSQFSIVRAKQDRAKAHKDRARDASDKFSLSSCIYRHYKVEFPLKLYHDFGLRRTRQPLTFRGRYGGRIIAVKKRWEILTAAMMRSPTRSCAMSAA